MRRFIGQMLFGIQAAQDVKLSQIGRELQEPIRIGKVENRLRRNLAREAIAETFALGLPITFLKRGRLYHRFPDGTETPVTEKEMLEVAGFVYP